MNEFPVLAWWVREGGFRKDLRNQQPDSLPSLLVSIEWLVCPGCLKLIQLRFFVHSAIIKQGQLNLIKLR